MMLRFQERIGLPVSEVYGFFRTPEDWVRLYGSFGEVERLEDGWRVVRLKGSPFPLVAKITEDEPNRRVRWIFRGFWDGEGEVDFVPMADGVVVEGYERIRPRGPRLLTRVVERLLLERRFRAIWASGFRRLRRRAEAARAPG